MATRFADLLRQHLQARGLSQNAFAKEVGRGSSYISQVATGRVGPPDDLEAWADALRLRGKDRETFLEEGFLLRTPEFIRKRYRKLVIEPRRS